mmetsp:Transcript_73973/g.239128  ORF Transcript_73973/g.239128 Transcript_73973/m.239128 type:complete len:202 (-) Transcript_73973:175-780(-)
MVAPLHLPSNCCLAWRRRRRPHHSFQACWMSRALLHEQSSLTPGRNRQGPAASKAVQGSWPILQPSGSPSRRGLALQLALLEHCSISHPLPGKEGDEEGSAVAFPCSDTPAANVVPRANCTALARGEGSAGSGHAAAGLGSGLEGAPRHECSLFWRPAAFMREESSCNSAACKAAAGRAALQRKGGRTLLPACRPACRRAR